MGLTVRESNPGVGEVFAHGQNVPGSHPSTYRVGTRSLSGVNRPGLGVDHTTSSGEEVKEMVGLYFYSPSGTSWTVRV